jgi:hypothetical protein
MGQADFTILIPSSLVNNGTVGTSTLSQLCTLILVCLATLVPC